MRPSSIFLLLILIQGRCAVVPPTKYDVDCDRLCKNHGSIDIYWESDVLIVERKPLSCHNAEWDEAKKAECNGDCKKCGDCQDGGYDCSRLDPPITDPCERMCAKYPREDDGYHVHCSKIESDGKLKDDSTADCKQCNGCEVTYWTKGKYDCRALDEESMAACEKLCVKFQHLNWGEDSKVHCKEVWPRSAGEECLELCRGCSECTPEKGYWEEDKSNYDCKDLMDRPGQFDRGGCEKVCEKYKVNDTESRYIRCRSLEVYEEAEECREVVCENCGKCNSWGDTQYDCHELEDAFVGGCRELCEEFTGSGYTVVDCNSIPDQLERENCSTTCDGCLGCEKGNSGEKRKYDCERLPPKTIPTTPTTTTEDPPSSPSTNVSVNGIDEEKGTEKKTGISAGIIAGIVIGVIALCCAGGLASQYCKRSADPEEVPSYPPPPSGLAMQPQYVTSSSSAAASATTFSSVATVTPQQPYQR